MGDKTHDAFVLDIELTAKIGRSVFKKVGASFTGHTNDQKSLTIVLQEDVPASQSIILRKPLPKTDISFDTFGTQNLTTLKSWRTSSSFYRNIM